MTDDTINATNSNEFLQIDFSSKKKNWDVKMILKMSLRPEMEVQTLRRVPPRGRLAQSHRQTLGKQGQGRGQSS